MGITKAIEKPNGIVFNYHRVDGVFIHTNNQNVINVSNYLTAAKRQEEVECMARLRAGDNEAECNVLIEGMYVTAPYDPSMTIESAYEYLLTLPEFEGAELEDTEFQLDAEELIPEIEAELQAEQPAEEPAPEQNLVEDDYATPQRR